MKALVVNLTIREEGDVEPSLIVTKRLDWPDGAPLEDVVMEAAEKACREVHTMRKQWVTT